MTEGKQKFQRYEMKYLLTSQQYEELMDQLQTELVPDDFGDSTICNVYYDTPDHRLIRRSLEKPVYKEKLRLRSYGSVGQEDTVFLELKKKYQGVVYKRRIPLQNREAEDYFKGLAPLPSASQIGAEIDYAKRFYKELIPAMYISYSRSAFFSKEEPQLRITFDRNLLWRETELSLCTLPYGDALLQQGMVLLEVKSPGGLPLWLTHRLTQRRLYPIAFSKYGSAFLSAGQTREKGGLSCA